VYNLMKKEYWQRRKEWLMSWRKTVLGLLSKLQCCSVITVAVQSDQRRTVNGSNVKKLGFFLCPGASNVKNQSKARGKGL